MEIVNTKLLFFGMGEEAVPRGEKEITLLVIQALEYPCPRIAAYHAPGLPHDVFATGGQG